VWADPIDSRYLLVINIPHHRNPDGTCSVDQLWHKDLQMHRNYLTDLRLASPRRQGEAPASEMVLEDGEVLGSLSHVAMPDPRSVPGSLLTTPRAFARLWKAIGESDVVHVGVGGWPYPLGWPAALIAKMRKKFLIVVVESAPWRLGLRPGASLKAKVLGHVYERMAQWSVNRADLALFTQAEYQSSLLRPGGTGLVTNASWIDEEVVLSDLDAARSWDEKPSPPLRLLFAGRITANKGVGPLLEAARTLASAGVHARIDVMGEGDMLDDCKAMAASLGGPTTLRILRQVPYGPEFFRAVRDCHAVLVPSLADEQPRIIYDAYSQAVPVIASDTVGIRDCVVDGESGVLVPPGDPTALAAAMIRAAGDPGSLRVMGLKGLGMARKYTHAEMHRIRHSILKRMIGSTRPGDRGALGADADRSATSGV
jgi:glycosyltransferase involved in cell wall biosynthesis